MLEKTIVGGNNVVMGFQAGAFQSKTNRTSIGSKSKAGNYSVAVGHNSSNGSSTDYSVLVGNKTAQYTTGANNVAVGYEAGLGVTGTSTFANTVAVGYQALTALTTGTSNTAVGYQAGAALTAAGSNTFFGYQAGYQSSSAFSTDNTFIGSGAGSSLTTGAYSGIVAVGSGAGNNPNTRSVHIGQNSGFNNNGFGAVNIGFGAGGYGLSSNSVAIGYQANYASSTANKVGIGYGANAGANSVAIGYQAGESTGSGNIFIGYQAGDGETGSNKLFIENSNSATPLIYGEFDNDILRVNGTLQVNDPASTGYAFPTATGTLGQVLEVNASGDLAFATPSGGGGGGLGGADQTLTADRTIDTNGFNLDIELDPTGTADTFTIHDGTHDLFQVDTGTTGVLFSVNDVSGLPKLEVDEDQGVIAKSVKADDGALTAAGQYGKGAEIWYQGTGATQAGSACYLNSSGNWTKTNATNNTNSVGMLAIAAGSDSDVNGMVTRGFVYVSADPGGSVGDVVYLSAATDGLLTTTAPTGTTGFVVRVIGHKVGTNIIYFNPSNDFITLA